MEVTVGRRIERENKRLENLRTITSRSKIQFYDNFQNLPEVSIEFILESVRERLLILEVFEKTNNQVLKSSSNYVDFIDSRIRSLKLWSALFSDSPEHRDKLELHLKKDLVSYLFCVMALSRDHFYRSWLKKVECDLFMYRCSIERTNVSKKDLISYLKINCKVVDEETKEQFSDEIKGVFSNESKIYLDSMSLYSVPMFDVPNIVKSRKCFLNKGLAYVLHRDIDQMIISHFNCNHSSIAAKCIKQSLRQAEFKKDTKMETIINSITEIAAGIKFKTADTTQWINKLYNPNSDGITQEIMLSSYPLCMQMMMKCLLETSHLKYQARIQLGLFLKATGASYETSLNFFKKIFTKKMSVERFNKEYSYQIRYNYGMEGKKVSYSAQSCSRLIANTNSSDCHGCPFNTKNTPELIKNIKEFQPNIDSFDLEDIISGVSSGQYTSACASYFKIQNKIECENEQTNIIISHPNQYYEESLKQRDRSKNVKE
ncbi:MAG: hypothetical protein MHMPM18_001392 [Marteilia pararefringens]